MGETVLLGMRRIQIPERSSITLHSTRAAGLMNHLVPELRPLDGHNKPYNVQETVINCLYAGQ